MVYKVNSGTSHCIFFGASLYGCIYSALAFAVGQWKTNKVKTVKSWVQENVGHSFYTLVRCRSRGDTKILDSPVFFFFLRSSAHFKTNAEPKTNKQTSSSWSAKESQRNTQWCPHNSKFVFLWNFWAISSGFLSVIFFSWRMFWVFLPFVLVLKYTRQWLKRRLNTDSGRTTPWIFLRGKNTHLPVSAIRVEPRVDEPVKSKRKND